MIKKDKLLRQSQINHDDSLEKIANDKENLVILLLSGYVRELKEGSDYLEKTIEYAKRITKLFENKK